MENHKIVVDIEYISKILKEQSLDKKTIQSMLLDLVEKSNINNPIIISESIVNEILDKLFDEPKVELSDFEKLLQKAINFNPKKK